MVLFVPGSSRLKYECWAMLMGVGPSEVASKSIITSSLGVSVYVTLANTVLGKPCKTCHCFDGLASANSLAWADACGKWQLHRSHVCQGCSGRKYNVTAFDLYT